MKNEMFVFDINDEEIIEKSKPKNKDEKLLLKILLNSLGEFTTIPEISKTLKISKTYLYRARDERRFVSYAIGSRVLVLTKTLVHFMRTYEKTSK